MSHDTEEWCKIWGKADLLFLKWLKLGGFWHNHLNVSETAYWLVPFVQKYITYLKKYREVTFHDT